MAKFKIEIELSWIDEQDNIDEAVKRAVIKDVTDKVSLDVIEQVKKEAQEGIVKQINEKVDSSYESILDQPIKVTDRWGTVKEEYPSLRDAVIARFDKYLNGWVDNRGRDSNARNGDTTRIKYIIDEQIKTQSEKFMKEAVEKVKVDVANALDQNLKKYVGDKLVDLVQLNKFIDSQKKLK